MHYYAPCMHEQQVLQQPVDNTHLRRGCTTRTKTLRCRAPPIMHPTTIFLNFNLEHYIPSAIYTLLLLGTVILHITNLNCHIFYQLGANRTFGPNIGT